MKPEDLKEEIFIKLEWDRMRDGIATVDEVFICFKTKLQEFLQTLESD